MSRELLQQALDALEEAAAYTSSPSWSPSMTEECTAVAASIRAHLAAQPAPVPKPEPVAIVRTGGHKGASVDWFAGLGEECSVGDLLYASPPAPVPVPLTDEQIDAMWRQPMSADWEHREFARAIEAHHGIAASPEKKP
jgi:hypothetical protein